VSVMPTAPNADVAATQFIHHYCCNGNTTDADVPDTHMHQDAAVALDQVGTHKLWCTDTLSVTNEALCAVLPRLRRDPVK